MEASPVSVVFNGVPVGTTREVRVLVVNKRHHLVRFRLATCSKNAQPLPSAFEVLIPRLGQVAAGMGQPVSILYTPTELKRITASIVLESEYDQLVIPIEVFPIKTSIIAPAEVAFGDVAVAAKIVKSIPIHCMLPVSFHFNAELRNPNPHLTILNPIGLVEANTVGAIKVEFNAVSLSTSISDVLIQIRILQPHLNEYAEEEDYSVDPLTCKLVARCVPGLTTERLIAQSMRTIDTVVSQTALAIDTTLSSELKSTTLKNVHSTTSLSAVSSVVALPSLSSKKLASSGGSAKKILVGSGSGAVFDPGSEWIRKKKSKHKPVAVGPSNEERIVDGVVIPSCLDSQIAVNYVLTQDRPTMKLNELHKLLDSNKHAKNNHKKKQERGESK